MALILFHCLPFKAVNMKGKFYSKISCEIMYMCKHTYMKQTYEDKKKKKNKSTDERRAPILYLIHLSLSEVHFCHVTDCWNVHQIKLDTIWIVFFVGSLEVQSIESNFRWLWFEISYWILVANTHHISYGWILSRIWLPSICRLCLL